MTEFTPWKKVEDAAVPKGWFYVVDSRRSIVATGINDEANARLMAASPALYEALKKLKNPSYDPGRGSGAHRDDFWKAIDMATKALALVDGDNQ